MATGEVSDIQRVIQLAITPVFLLTAVGAFLSVLNARLGRIVDRTRVLAQRKANAPESAQLRLVAELALLGRRRRLVNLAITFGTLAALLVCVLIAIAFVGALAQVSTAPVVATLFVGVMLAVVVELVLFLREVMIASASTDVELG